jgi:hypothetical protein
MPTTLPAAIDVVMFGGANVFALLADPDLGGAPTDKLSGKTITSAADSDTNLQATGEGQLYEMDGSTTVGDPVTLAWDATLLADAGAWVGRLPATVTVQENAMYLARITLTLTDGTAFPFWRRVKFVRLGEA